LGDFDIRFRRKKQAYLRNSITPPARRKKNAAISGLKIAAECGGSDLKDGHGNRGGSNAVGHYLE
jgi:hypothetical protein